MNEAAEQERAALEQEERMKIDQNFEQNVRKLKQNIKTKRKTNRITRKNTVS